MNPDNSFFGAGLKIKRAQFHIDQLVTLTQPLSHNLYSFGWLPATGRPCAISACAPSSNPDDKVFELTFSPKQPISEICALWVGDAVHNLRSALDYAATAVIRATGGDTSFVTFPFHEKKENLVPSQCRGLRQIQTALPAADVLGFFQDTVKPYSDGNADLWALTKIDKIDKHNFILPTVTLAGISDATILEQAGLTVEGVFAARDANQEFAVYRASFKGRDVPEHKVDVCVEIKFPEGPFFGGCSVIPTLTKLDQIVSETLLSFERFAIESGVYNHPVLR